MIRFKASDLQLLQIAANAVNASGPVGLGVHHYQDKKYTTNDVAKCRHNSELSIAYFVGRMVKLHIRQQDDGTWVIRDEPRADYQSWSQTYYSTKLLIESVPGVEIVEYDRG